MSNKFTNGAEWQRMCERLLDLCDSLREAAQASPLCLIAEEGEAKYNFKDPYSAQIDLYTNLTARYGIATAHRSGLETTASPATLSIVRP